MIGAKIRLSQKEMELAGNADLILTKNAVLQKINQLLGSLQEKQKGYIIHHSIQLPIEVLRSSPKISKGENYNGFPYQLLDYPKFFEKANIFAVRTLFWWGHFFSITLHLSGKYKTAAEQPLLRSFAALQENGFYCSVNNDPWKHDFDAVNYTLLQNFSREDFEQLVTDKPFIKLAKKIPFEQWDMAEDVLFDYFKEIMDIAGN
ncbi:MAG: hypothetical protein SGI83_07495 [Bacteroidota bacterium]|nr:hypothetical protein [Bacteroidota bacterium]